MNFILQIYSPVFITLPLLSNISYDSVPSFFFDSTSNKWIFNNISKVSDDKKSITIVTNHFSSYAAFNLPPDIFSKFESLVSSNPSEALDLFSSWLESKLSSFYNYFNDKCFKICGIFYDATYKINSSEYSFQKLEGSESNTSFSVSFFSDNGQQIIQLILTFYLTSDTDIEIFCFKDEIKKGDTFNLRINLSCYKEILPQNLSYSVTGPIIIIDNPEQTYLYKYLYGIATDTGLASFTASYLISNDKKITKSIQLYIQDSVTFSIKVVYNIFKKQFKGIVCPIVISNYQGQFEFQLKTILFHTSSSIYIDSVPLYSNTPSIDVDCSSHPSSFRQWISNVKVQSPFIGRVLVILLPDNKSSNIQTIITLELYDMINDKICSYIYNIDLGAHTDTYDLPFYPPIRAELENLTEGTFTIPFSYYEDEETFSEGESIVTIKKIIP